MIFQLFYLSQESRSLNDEDLAAIYEKSAENNSKEKITGMLFYSNGYFLQVLEGEEQQIRDLYEKIGRDERHMNSYIVHDQKSDERIFPDWSMGFRKLEGDQFANIRNHGDQHSTQLYYQVNGKQLIEMVKQLEQDQDIVM